jgi:hypothetical protein
LRDFGKLLQVRARHRFQPVLPVPICIVAAACVGDNKIYGVAEASHGCKVHEPVINDAVFTVTMESRKQKRLVSSWTLEADLVSSRPNISGDLALHHDAFQKLLQTQQM